MNCFALFREKDICFHVIYVPRAKFWKSAILGMLGLNGKCIGILLKYWISMFYFF